MIRIQLVVIMQPGTTANKIILIQIMELNIHLVNRLRTEMIEQAISLLVINLIILSKFIFNWKLLLIFDKLLILYCFFFSTFFRPRQAFSGNTGPARDTQNNRYQPYNYNTHRVSIWNKNCIIIILCMRHMFFLC